MHVCVCVPAASVWKCESNRASRSFWPSQCLGNLLSVGEANTMISFSVKRGAAFLFVEELPEGDAAHTRIAGSTPSTQALLR